MPPTPGSCRGQARPSSLSIEETEELFDIIRQIKKEGIGIIYISHKLKEIKNVLGQKRLEMLRDLSPKTSTVAMLVNPVSPDTISEIRSVQTGALALGIKLAMFNASTLSEIEAAFNSIAEQRPDALLIGGDPFFLVNVRRLSRRRGSFRFRLSIHFVSLWWPAA